MRKATDHTWQVEAARTAKAKWYKSGTNRDNEEGEEETEFVADTTGDAALQENYISHLLPNVLHRSWG